MASSLCALATNFKPFPSLIPFSHGSRRLSTPPPMAMAISVKNNLSSSKSLSGFPLVLNKPISPLRNSPRNQALPLTVVADKGYKMKTHKASAKRFRVTGRGKIVRRRAGKQHLLAKKNTKRKLRLSKMTAKQQDRHRNQQESTAIRAISNTVSGGHQIFLSISSSRLGSASSSLLHFPPLLQLSF